MRSAPPVPAVSLIVRLLLITSAAGLLVLTLLDRGATRAYAFPWSALREVVLAAPIAALAVRGLSRESPLCLPSRGWRVAAALFFFGALGSALLSPFRGPSLREALTPLAMTAAFLLVHDWLAGDRAVRERQLLRLCGWFATAIVLVSLGRWFVYDLLPAGTAFRLSWIIDHRNAHPLGHSNYTAGLALLALPWFAALARRETGRARFGWGAMAIAALVMLFGSGSRGGLLGLAALLVAAIGVAPLGWKRRLVILLLAGAGVLALALAHPRTRAMLFARPTANAEPNVSNVQRSAMLAAGLRMGADRPVFGYGPGATPRAFPRYRGGLDGGAENVLQLHCTPLQLWAEGGLVALAAVLLLAGLAVRHARRNRPAFVALAGYGLFALTDYQLDVPVFAAAMALCAALLARTDLYYNASSDDKRLHASRDGRMEANRGRDVGVGALALVALAVVAALGRRDPTPELNVRALALASQPAEEEHAIALLRESLVLNPDQEIARFNLGWLLVVRAPAEAENHFLAAARLVPDKGGVYFGLGLARLNRDRPDSAARAFALECLNDPLFLSSPWWRDSRVGATRTATLEHFRRFASAAAAMLAEKRDQRRVREVRFLDALGGWLDGHATLGDVLAHAHTSARVSFFSSRPAVPDFSEGGVRVSRRERTGYPVLMRDLDLPPPVDVFAVQESAAAVDGYAFLFPPKGWLPGPVLLTLLAGPVSVTD